MSILIFANGNLAPGDWVRPYLAEATALIAADGGVEHLLALDQLPDVVIGDLDSADGDTIDRLRAAAVEVLVHPEMKDESDLELALQHAATHYDEEIILMGALGGRLDQLLANVFLLLAPFLAGRTVKLVDQYQTAWILREGENGIGGKQGDLVSLLPLGGDVRIKRTTGLAWPLTDEALVQGLSRGISNRMTAETATVTVEDGTLLCVHLDANWQR
ncbi:MAG: thiamine diphosphokinase [Chloroflexota bacterium]|jgi:thiamine pyrophosphokinase